MFELLLPFFLLAIGFVLLVKGADLLVDGSVSLAKRWGISELVIGLTVVAFGTSAPELFVNVMSSIKGTSGITVGNIIGSNIANLALVLGAAGLLRPMLLQRSLLTKDIPISLLGAGAIYFLARSAGDSLVLNTVSGGLLIAGFVGFLYLVWRDIITGRGSSMLDEIADTKQLSIPRALSYALGGFVGLALGGQLVVDSAVTIAMRFGVSEAFIGLSIIALGTSLPELVTSIVAALKNRIGLAIGNAVGSNIFNIFWVLGISALINPITYDRSLLLDLGVLTGITVLIAALPYTNKAHELRRWHAMLLILCYVSYIGYITWRG